VPGEHRVERIDVGLEQFDTRLHCGIFAPGSSSAAAFSLDQDSGQADCNGRRSDWSPQ
jgi:hypothetical protein